MTTRPTPKNSRRHWLACALFLVASGAFAADWAPGSTDWDKLPDAKKSKAGLYLTPQQAYAMKQKDPQGIAFFDIRTRAEAVFVGMPTDVDALVPFVEFQEIMVEWDDKRHMYKLEPNQDFVTEFERRLKEKGLGKDATVILICLLISITAITVSIQTGYFRFLGT